MASTIIQSYFKPILESYLTSNVNLRISVVNCLNQILNQGLIYPIECVPYLIAMTTDIEKKIQVKALTHLTNLHKAHPGLIQSKSIGGFNMSFRLQKIIQSSLETPTLPATSTGSSTKGDEVVIRGISETNTEILSLNHHLYNLLRVQRSFRRAFIQQLLKMFDDTSSYHASLSHLFYICDNLAYFPYQLIDEPLYLIHQIDIIISVTGVNILHTFKENLISKKTIKSNDKRNSEKAEENKGINVDADKMCLDLDMSHICPSDEEEALAKANNIEKETVVNNVKKIQAYEDDDEEETIEYVVENLPTDLKPLKDCMTNAQGCCLLLILKQFLKEVYSINDS